jgi:hypothetical protein
MERAMSLVTLTIDEHQAILDEVYGQRGQHPRFLAAVAFVLDPHGHGNGWKGMDDEWARWRVRNIGRRGTLDEAVRFLDGVDYICSRDHNRWIAQTVRLLLGVDPILTPKYQSVDCQACGARAGERCRSKDGLSTPLSYHHFGRACRARQAGVYRRKPW